MADWVKVTSVRKKTSFCSTGQCSAVVVDTQPKFGAGTNKKHPTPISPAQLDRETEELKHDKIPFEVGKLIMKGRQALGLTQKDLAIKICEKHQIVAEYEAGRGIPNDSVLSKIERAIGLKLRGKQLGQPLPPLGKK